MDIKPNICLSGSAFIGNSIQVTRPITAIKGRHQTNFVSLTDWCSGNFITKRVGYILIKKKLLIGQRMWRQWWVCANPDCLDRLLDYLELEQLFFDAEN